MKKSKLNARAPLKKSKLNARVPLKKSKPVGAERAVVADAADAAVRAERVAVADAGPDGGKILL